MKVLFATKNPAKVRRFKEALEKNNVELITLKDLDFNIKVNENGKNALENAFIKAKSYYDATKIITIGMDDNLFFENLPNEKQPGTYVRRVNGKELNDDEMIEYYTNLAKQYNGKINAKWVYGMVIYNGQEAKEFSWSSDIFYLIDKPCEKRNPGYPLDSISINPKLNKYFVNLTPGEKNTINAKPSSDTDVIDFILKNILN